MKVTNRGKKAWFKKHVLEFELSWYDRSENPRIARYRCDNGLIVKSFASLSNSDAKRIAYTCEEMQPWEIFFKYRHANPFKDNRVHVPDFDWVDKIG